ncbi:hypothetical protein SNOG_20056 [Parastagonospora nodorum SN15]|uniref:Uncharacterized protein n=1 Tax=Phaeosphaeria nodorum (strain SN15 / ATCC MYA-4574 / FGSC 10173) TaxID=321614 RepID=A9JX54_PHANO|nr:hypothetical protein SNOG_20056 [Parastagonospora nodorum SN15]EDP89912.1 hypothetical protein SNOG_20056 [Parastagonospora nodorum SN15]
MRYNCTIWFDRSVIHGYCGVIYLAYCPDGHENVEDFLTRGAMLVRSTSGSVSVKGGKG